MSSDLTSPATVAITILATAYLFLLSLTFVGSAWMFPAANIDWYVGMFAMAAGGVAFVATRRKIIFFILLLALLILSTSAYVRNGADSFPIIYRAKSS